MSWSRWRSKAGRPSQSPSQWPKGKDILNVTAAVEMRRYVVRIESKSLIRINSRKGLGFTAGTQISLFQHLNNSVGFIHIMKVGQMCAGDRGRTVSDADRDSCGAHMPLGQRQSPNKKFPTETSEQIAGERDQVSWTWGQSVGELLKVQGASWRR